MSFTCIIKAAMLDSHSYSATLAIKYTSCKANFNRVILHMVRSKGLNSVSVNPRPPGTSECGLIWKESLQMSSLKMRSYSELGWA